MYPDITRRRWIEFIGWALRRRIQRLDLFGLIIDTQT